MDINNLQHRIEWEKYYSPKFDWTDFDNIRKMDKTQVFNSLEFVKEFATKIDWGQVLHFCYLDEEILEYFLTEVIRYFSFGHREILFYSLSRYQKLSEAFILKYLSVLDLPRIAENQNISNTLKEILQPYIDYQHKQDVIKHDEYINMMHHIIDNF